MSTILKTWRESASKSVTEAAQAAGVTPAMWSRWENERRAIPVERAVDLERLIGIPRSDLRPDIFGQPETAA